MIIDAIIKILLAISVLAVLVSILWLVAVLIAFVPIAAALLAVLWIAFLALDPLFNFIGRMFPADETATGAAADGPQTKTGDMP